MPPQAASVEAGGRPRLAGRQGGLSGGDQARPVGRLRKRPPLRDGKRVRPEPERLRRLVWGHQARCLRHPHQDAAGSPDGVSNRRGP